MAKFLRRLAIVILIISFLTPIIYVFIIQSSGPKIEIWDSSAQKFRYRQESQEPKIAFELIFIVTWIPGFFVAIFCAMMAEILEKLKEITEELRTLRFSQTKTVP